ncbi:alpha/beta hydrolase [Gaopeijia maritima]|uniref:alpha/beta hydrolase n=1 Tax=Gaopeijia maritima TaxID=3119007 RepID=UPI0032764590
MTTDDAALRFEIERPDEADGTVVVLLHGRGADRHDLRGLHRHLPAGITLVTPEAPHPGRPWGYGTGWAWYRYKADDRVVEPTLTDSLDRLERFLAELPDRVGMILERVILGGFSQGGTTSLAYALTRPGQVAGIAMLSGFLVDAPDAVPVTDSGAEGLRVFWGHGFADPAIPHALAVRGRARLDGVGAKLTSRDYPMGHQIAPREMDDLAGWMAALDG